MPSIKDRLQQDKVIEILAKEVKQKEQCLNLKRETDKIWKVSHKLNKILVSYLPQQLNERNIRNY